MAVALAITLPGCDRTDKAELADPDPVVDPLPVTPPDTGEKTMFTGPTGPLPGEPALLRLAVIGDYGSASDNEAAVAALVDSLEPDAVVTVGDNNYDTTAGHDIRIGQFYQQYIWPYAGLYGGGSADGENHFWPCLGNHDWDAGIEDWYLYFELPGNERYWSVPLGTDPDTGGPLVEWFCVDSDPREPDGTTPSSVQSQWLRDSLVASEARWQIVAFHHPPWSSGTHGDNLRLQWPYAVWGADLVLAGHDHLYERLVRDGLVHVTEGRGGQSLYRTIGRTVWSEQVFDEDYGMTVVDVGLEGIGVTALTPTLGVVDELLVLRERPFSPDTPLVRLHSTWRWSPAEDAGPGWEQPGYDDSLWDSGVAQLGYGEGDEATRYLPAPGPVTWYYRYAFQVDVVPTDPLTLTLLRDDGAAVYLNGVEIARDNLPAGVLAADTVATIDLVLPTEEEIPVVASVDPGLLVVGRNVLAVEVHNAAGLGTADTSFDLALRVSNPDRLLAEGSTWSFQETAPRAGWQQPAFDSSGWAVGPAPLGYGHADVATLLAEGDALARPPAVWLRTQFEVADPAAFGALWLACLRDDGLVVWLNGRELYRTNMPAGPPVPTAYALAESGVEWADVWTGTWVDPGGLVAGTNTLAVEVHQGAAAGVDLRFDLRLIGVQ
ncbi:MAG: metallophosphoesterase [Deltaproteobacteria bacterium]|nr:metallophosphoesterase [Deltaproteobacteria bacterium]